MITTLRKRGSSGTEPLNSRRSSEFLKLNRGAAKRLEWFKAPADGLKDMKRFLAPCGRLTVVKALQLLRDGTARFISTSSTSTTFIALHERHMSEINGIAQSTLVEHAASPLEDLVRVVRAMVEAMARPTRRM